MPSKNRLVFATLQGLSDKLQVSERRKDMNLFTKYVHLAFEVYPRTSYIQLRCEAIKYFYKCTHIFSVRTIPFS